LSEAISWSSAGQTSQLSGFSSPRRGISWYQTEDLREKIFKFNFLANRFMRKSYIKPRIRRYTILFRFRPEEKVLDLRKRRGKTVV